MSGYEYYHKGCGGPVVRIVPEGTPYWHCGHCGKVNWTDIEEIDEDQEVMP